MAESEGSIIDEAITGNQDVYKMSAANRGYCWIFLNINFADSPDCKRFGAEIDSQKLADTFKQLKFEPRQFLDYCKDQIFKQLKSLSTRRVEFEVHDAFVAIFSSHGSSSLIYDSNCVAIPIDTIVEMLSSEKCPALCNKPKILIFLCCRGGENLIGVNLSHNYEAGYDFDNNDEEEEEENEQVAIYEDIIICYSTVKKFISLRHPDEGTYYGNFLVQNLNKFGHDRDFEYILKKTAQDMAAVDDVFFGDERIRLMSSVKSIGWKKTLYFNPNYPA